MKEKRPGISIHVFDKDVFFSAISLVWNLELYNLYHDNEEDNMVTFNL